MHHLDCFVMHQHTRAERSSSSNFLICEYYRQLWPS